MDVKALVSNWSTGISHLSDVLMPALIPFSKIDKSCSDTENLYILKYIVTLEECFPWTKGFLPHIFRGACAYKGIFYSPEMHTYHERADNGEPP